MWDELGTHRTIRIGKLKRSRCDGASAMAATAAPSNCKGRIRRIHAADSVGS